MKLYMSRWIPTRRRFAAIALPPIGVFVRAPWWWSVSEEEQNRLIAHETIHWQQYEQRGVFRYYWDYLVGWLRYGYRNHPMEIEARQG